MLQWTVPLGVDALFFFLAAAVIGYAGSRAATLADQLADRTGMGEALTGMVFLGLITALPGLVASVVAAAKGHPELAVANAVGGIAIQTTTLAVADIVYRKANLEHAAASAENMMQTIVLILLLTLVLAGLLMPNVTIGSVHVMTPTLIVSGGFAFWLVFRTRAAPMWRPMRTDETVEDMPDPANLKKSLYQIVPALVIAAGVTAVGGAVVAESAENIIEQTDLNDVVVGGLFMAIATSLPEFVTSIAAVRRGALTLAVGDVVGGNFFDVLIVAAADIAYIEGSLYHGPGVEAGEWLLTTITILLNVVLLTGLIYRQKRGPANIGFESVLMLVIYVGGFVVMATR